MHSMYLQILLLSHDGSERCFKGNLRFMLNEQVRLTPVRPQQFSKIQLNDDGQLRPKFVS